MRFRLQLCLLLSLLTLCSSFSIFIDNVQLSTTQTLQPNTLYAMNISLNNNDIPAGAKVVLTFSNRYNINVSTLASCQVATSASAALASSTCTPTSTASNYFITYPNIYTAGATSQALLRIEFAITNPYGGTGTTETISVQIVDSGDSELAVAQTVLAFTPSTMTGCGYVGVNDTTGVNSSRTVSFTPSVEAIAGATLDITLPIWFDSTGSALDSLACTGVQNTDTASPTCFSAVYTDSGTGTKYEVITINSLVTSNKNLSTPIITEMSPLRNPWNLAAFGPIRYELKVGSIVSQ